MSPRRYLALAVLALWVALDSSAQNLYRLRLLAGGGGDFIYESGFSGPATINDGAEVTITKSGGGFGTKPNGAKPLYYFNFGSGNEGLDSSYSRTTPYTGGEIFGDISQTIVRPGSTHSLHSDQIALTTGWPDLVALPASDRIYSWVSRYYDFPSDGQDFGIKNFRLRNDASGGTIYHGFRLFEGADGNPAYISEFTGGASRWGGPPFYGQQWVVEDCEFQASAIDTEDGRFVYMIDGQLNFARSIGWVTKNNSNPIDGIIFDQGAQGILGGPPTGMSSAHVYISDWYIDDSPARVVVSAETAWQEEVYPAGSRFTREIQLPTAWSNTSITFKVMKRSLSTLSAKRLYVIIDGDVVNGSSRTLLVGRWP